MRIGHRVARALAGLALLSASAQAQVVVTNTTKYTAPWNTNNPSGLFQIYLQQLNTNYSYFGAVLSIEVGLYSTNIFDYELENTSPGAALFELEGSGNTYATNPGPAAVVGVHSGLLFSTNLAGSDGNSGSGNDYAYFNDIKSVGSHSNLITSAFNSLYFGASTFAVDINSRVSSTLFAAGTYTASRLDDRSLGVAYVIYTYTLVPEPGAFIPLAGVGLGLVWWARRRRSPDGRRLGRPSA